MIILKGSASYCVIYYDLWSEKSRCHLNEKEWVFNDIRKRSGNEQCFFPHYTVASRKKKNNNVAEIHILMVEGGYLNDVHNIVKWTLKFNSVGLYCTFQNTNCSKAAKLHKINLEEDWLAFEPYWQL